MTFSHQPVEAARWAAAERDHLVSADALRKLVGQYLQFDDLADAPIPLHLVAYDVDRGDEVLLSEGPALDAIAATAAVPGVLPPVRVGDRRLIDGGVVENNTPISHAVELGAERIDVLPMLDPSPVPRSLPRGALGAAMGADSASSSANGSRPTSHATRTRRS